MCSLMLRRTKPWIFVLLLLIILSGCKRFSDLKGKKPVNLEEAPSESWFSGGLGPQLPIRMVLRRTGTKFVGKYVYEQHPSPIELEGTLTTSGDIQLNESANGKATGYFNGRIDGYQFVGQWNDPSGKRVLPFKLDIARGRTLLLREQTIDWTGHGKCIRSIAEKFKCVENTTFDCTLKASWFEVLDGLDGPPAAALNKLLRPNDIDNGSCTLSRDVRTSSNIHRNDDGVLSVVIAYSWYIGGTPHPDESRSYVNYWLDEARHFTLRDAFAPAAIAVFAKHAQEVSADVSDYVRSSVLSLDNQEFAVEREGIRLFGFNATNHANRAVAPDVLITFDELRSAIKNPGPLAKFATPP